MNNEELTIGSRVHYAPSHGKMENGIVKSHNEFDTSTVFVVYHCAGDWENYMNYTGASTKISELRPGWAEDVNIEEYKLETIGTVKFRGKDVQVFYHEERFVGTDENQATCVWGREYLEEMPTGMMVNQPELTDDLSVKILRYLDSEYKKRNG